MREFIVENSFWDKFPDAKIGIIICKDLDNSNRESEYYEALLSDAILEAQKHIKNPEFSDNEVIKLWREAFRKFKSKKGARSSIESLLKRVQNGTGIRNINPLVDIYNSISLRYGLPCGGEDIETFAGDVKLKEAKGNESFVPVGAEESDHPYRGEIIYSDDEGAICRCLNWRESQRTMLTEHTKKAFMCMESISIEHEIILEEALNELSELIEIKLGAKTEIFILNKNNFKIQFEV